jgi:hypothetical protein
MKQKIFFRIWSIATIISLVGIWIPKVEAATLSTARDYLSTLQENQTTGVTHEINFTTATNISGGAGLNKIILVFPDADDGNWCSTAGTDLTVTTTSLKDSATVLPGTSKTARCVKGSGLSNYDTLTIEGVDNLTAGTLYGVRVADGSTGKLGTPDNTTTGIITVKANNGSSDVDTGYIAVDILSTNQITISGQVNPTLSFSITDTAIGFGTVTSAAIKHATADEQGAASEPASGNPTQLSVSTNADDGAVIEIRDTNSNSTSGMYSAGTGTTLTSVASTGVGAGTEEFGVYGKNASSLTIAEGFDNDSNADSAITTTFQTLASSTAPVSSATVDVAALAAVAATTPAGTFADTLYVVATGKF